MIELLTNVITVFLALLSAFALLVKFIALKEVRFKSNTALSFAALCYTLIALNISELLLYLSVFWSADIAGFALHCALLSVYLVPIPLYLLSRNITSYRLTTVFLAFFTCFGLFIFWQHIRGQVITDVSFTSYYGIASAGVYFKLMNLYVVSAFLVVIPTFYRGWKRHEDKVTKLRCGITLLAILPLAFSMIVVPSLRQFGFNASAAAVIPVSSSFFLFVMLINNNDSLYKIRTKLGIFGLIVRRGHLIPDQNHFRFQVIDNSQTVALEMGGTGIPAAKLQGISQSSVSKWKSKRKLPLARGNYKSTTLAIKYRLLFSFVFNNEVDSLKSQLHTLDKSFITDSKKTSGPTQKAIAGDLGVDRSTVSRQIDRFLSDDDIDTRKIEVFKNKGNLKSRKVSGKEISLLSALIIFFTAVAFFAL